MTHIWHKVLTKSDIGHIWVRMSNGTYDFLYLVSIILKNVVNVRLIDQSGVWSGSSEVSCKNWFRDGKGIGLTAFGVLLLSV